MWPFYYHQALKGCLSLESSLFYIIAGFLDATLISERLLMKEFFVSKVNSDLPSKKWPFHIVKHVRSLLIITTKLFMLDNCDSPRYTSDLCAAAYETLFFEAKSNLPHCMTFLSRKRPFQIVKYVSKMFFRVSLA